MILKYEKAILIRKVCICHVFLLLSNTVSHSVLMKDKKE